jgi:hypothetical protein
MGIEEGEEIQVKGTENIFNKIIVENSPNLEKERDIETQQAFRKQNKQDQKRNTPRHITVKALAIEQRMLKAAREKQQVNIKATHQKKGRFFNKN